MYPALTVCVSVGAVIWVYALCVGVGTDETSFAGVLFWMGIPYVGYCALAVARSRTGSSGLVFAGTLVSAGCASWFYAARILPFIEARLRGTEAGCGGPPIELLFPLVQWAILGLLWAITRPDTLRTKAVQQPGPEGDDRRRKPVNPASDEL
jgi:hypothetical protein